MSQGSNYADKKGKRTSHDEMDEEGDQRTVVKALSEQFSGCGVEDRVNTQYQIVWGLPTMDELLKIVREDTFPQGEITEDVKQELFPGGNLPKHVMHAFIEGHNCVVITTPELTEELPCRVLTNWQDAIMLQASKDEKNPQLSPSALLTGCIGKQMKHQGSQYATIFEAKLLTNGSEPRKFPMLVEAYKVLGIPFLKGAYKADGVGSEASHQPKKSVGKHANAAGKAVNLPKASKGQVDAKATDGAIVAMDAVATAVDKAKAVLSAARELERANQKFTKAVVAASVGEGKAAAGGGRASSGKEAKGNAVAGGGAAFSGKEAKGLGGGAVVQCGKSKVVEAAPSAADSARPTKRRSPEAN